MHAAVDVTALRCFCRYAWHIIFGEPPVLAPIAECDLLTCTQQDQGRGQQQQQQQQQQQRQQKEQQRQLKQQLALQL
jgi:hypothetical protein